MTSPSILCIAKPYLRALLCVAALRYVLEFQRNPGFFDAFGVYGASLGIFIALGFSGTIRERSIGRVLGISTWMAAGAWFLPNFVSYLTAQYAGWDHGRFAKGRAPDIAATVGGKFLAALGTAFGTTIAGTLWCGVLAVVCIWLPNRMRSGTEAT